MITISKSVYDTIMSEIAESDITARDFRIVDDILRKHTGVLNGDDCENSAE